MPIRWSRIRARIAVIVLLAVPCLIGAIVASVPGSIMHRTTRLAHAEPGLIAR